MTRPIVTKAPCAKCPFRKDVPIYLRAGAREEIARALADGRGFPCHATVNYDTDEEDEEGATIPDQSAASECAGAVAALELSGGSSQLARIAERLGDLDPDRPGHHDDVWPLHEWPLLAAGATGDNPEEEEYEGDTCSVVNAGCEAPAGYLGTGGAVVHGVEHTDNYCPGCGDPVCETCMADEELCPTCLEYEADMEEVS
ncbi:MAG TPA: hypothetical protein VMW08_00535 [Acidimicrobiales bacterium]|nr:hypothetical protein [Acidimicrobiales bacterium]